MLLYAAQHDDVPLVVNVAGRFHMKEGIKVCVCVYGVMGGSTGCGGGERE